MGAGQHGVHIPLHSGCDSSLLDKIHVFLCDGFYLCHNGDDPCPPLNSSVWGPILPKPH